MSAAPRTALWGGRDGEGEEEGARERGGPAEGRGPRESGAGKRGRGARGARLTGVPTEMGGGDRLGSPRAEPPGAGFRGALAFSSGDPPRGTRQTSAGEGEAGGRGYARGLVAVARKQWGGGIEVGGRRAHTPALRRRASERAGGHARALGGARAGGGPRRRSGSEWPAGRGSRGRARGRRGAAGGRRRARDRVHRRAAHVRLPGCGWLC